MTLAIFGGTPVASKSAHRTWPDFDADDNQAMTKALMSGSYGYGSETFETAQAAIAEHFGRRYALLVCCATHGLTAAQVVLGVRGRDVIQPPYSFQATPHSTDAAGGKAVFSEIRRDTFNLDPDQIEITDKTGAIMPVSMHGVLAQPSAFADLANRHGIPTIYDNAQAAGATAENGRYNAGNTGTLAVLSLNFKKAWCALQGGVVLTDVPELYDALKIYAQYGIKPAKGGGPPSYLTEFHGTNLAPPDTTAALAVSRLPKLAGYLETAQRHMDTLARELADLPGLLLPQVPDGSTSTCSRPRFGFDPDALNWKGDPRDFRNRLATALEAEGLPLGPWQEWPFNQHPAWRHKKPVYLAPGQVRPPLPKRPDPYDPDAFPATQNLLTTTFEIGKHPNPLWIQTDDVIDHYAAAFRKVWKHMDEVQLRRDFEITRPKPQPPRI